jgi:NACalpha-BTF3-like transcription factor
MFGQNQLKADMAMREFFYSTEGKKLDKKQKKSEVSRIVDEINIKFRENTAKELESIKKATPATLSDEEIIKRAGFTEEDVQFTMQQTGKSRSEIINYLRTK